MHSVNIRVNRNCSYAKTPAKKDPNKGNEDAGNNLPDKEVQGLKKVHAIMEKDINEEFYAEDVNTKKNNAAIQEKDHAFLKGNISREQNENCKKGVSRKRCACRDKGERCCADANGLVFKRRLGKKMKNAESNAKRDR